MKLRSLFPLPLSVGCCIANVASAQVAPMPAGNQALADRVASQLRSSGVGQGADVNIVTNGGKVELQGYVRTPGQRDQLLSIVKGTPGVESVQNSISVAEGQVAPQGVAPQGMPQGMTMQGGPQGMPQGMMMPGGGGDPTPGQLASHGHNIHDNNPPKMPGYSWPTYAPYNNFSRVAYPQSYPYNAWPFIGPFYPFPKVPLGWRKVSLEWEDGHWYYSPTSGAQDHWRVRFW